MFGVLAALSLWSATLASQPQATAAVPAGLPPSGYTTVTTQINSRLVRVQAQSIRSTFPPIGFIPGSQFLQLRISTSDPRGLPAISSVHATVINQQHQTWSSTPQLFSTPGSDPRTRSYSAANGPAWALGSQVTVRVEIHTGTGIQTTTVNIPTRIGLIPS
jgi:hypothetical protein